MSLREHLDTLITAAEQDLLGVTGGEAACVLHRDGRVTGGMKYHEGRLVALTRARRMLGEADPVAALEAAVTGWRTEFEQRTAVEDPAPPWVAYATGGLEAAREVLLLVRGSA